jgi:glutathione S-transferase
MVAYVERQLTEKAFAAGDRFTAADTQLASGINFTMLALKALPERPAFKDYLARIGERPAWKRAQARDSELARTVPAWAGTA